MVPFCPIEKLQPLGRAKEGFGLFYGIPAKKIWNSDKYLQGSQAEKQIKDQMQAESKPQDSP